MRLGTIVVILFLIFIHSGSAQDSTVTATQNLNAGVYNNLTINGSGIVVTLTGGVTVNGILTLTNGTILPGAGYLMLGANATVSGGNSTSYVNGTMMVTWPTSAGEVEKVFPIGKGTKYRPMNVKLAAPASQVLRGEVFFGDCGGTPGAGLAAISQYLYFRCEVRAGSVDSSLVRLGYYDEDSVKDSKTIRIGRCVTPNGVYDNIGSGGMGFPFAGAPGDVDGLYHVLANPVEFLIHATTNVVKNPLPVELISFLAIPHRGYIDLSWRTANEVENFGFEIERSIDRIAFCRVGFVEGHGTTNVSQSYDFRDDNIRGRASYRLKQIDRNGTFKYSESVEAMATASPTMFAMEQNYPNPSNPSTTIGYTIPTHSHVTLLVFNTLGRKVAELVNGEKDAGSYNVTFDARVLSSGVYLYRIQAGNFSQTRKLVVIK